MVGEVAVDIAVELDDLVSELPEQPRRDGARDAVAAVDHDRSGVAGGRGRDLRPDPPDVVAGHVGPLQTAPSRDQVVPLDSAPERLDGIAVQGVAGHHDLQPVVVGRIVAAGDHDAAAGFEMRRREVEERRGHQSDIDHVSAALAQSGDERRLQLGARVPSVAARHERLRAAGMRLGADGAADPANDLGGESVSDDAADVVGAEDVRGQME